ncbi:MAG: acyl-ACP thioesterase [Spirochaetaceae bacterium]|jgi:acyl-ACP thioesterase|nr:acyl-ACP thioesterase [Spirochaetaceae bacterium]
MDIFSEQQLIRFGHIDRSDALTLASTFDFFQEAAISHAEILGVGRDAMKETGQLWLLSRISVFMERRPRFNTAIRIRSWPRGANKLFAIRDYDIRAFSGEPPKGGDESGGAEGGAGGGAGGGAENGGAENGGAEKPLVRGRSAWLIVDMEKRRPLRPQAAVASFSSNEGHDALAGTGNEPPPSLGARSFTAEPVMRRVCYSDIDFNGHMNNTRYIQWIQDLLDIEILERAAQIRLDINYLSEARGGETIGLYMAPLEDPRLDSPDTPGVCTAAFALEGRRTGPEEGAVVFRAELRAGS